MKLTTLLFILFMYILGAGKELAGASLDSTHQIHFFKDCEESLATRFWLLHQAKEEILISYYIFDDDSIGMLFLNELIAIKDKKPEIDIQILVDGSAHSLSRNLMYYIQHSDIKIREYHPLPKLWVPFQSISVGDFFSALGTLNERMHDKLILIDRKYTLTGGRNIDGSYFGLETRNFMDIDILIQSDSIGQITSWYFDKLWQSDRVKILDPVCDFKKRKDYEDDINRFLSIRSYMLNHPDYDQFLKKIMNLSFTFIPIEKADFLHSFCPKKDDFIPQKMSNEFLNLIAGSQKSVIIETPYLVCTKELTELVKQLRNRNVKVTFITNSFCSTDITVAAAAYDLKKKELIDLGVELYEYAGDSYLHAKTALLDKKIGFIGTYNMDPRSASINTETMFMFKGDQATQELYNKMQEDIDMSNKVRLVDGKISWEDQNCEKADLDWLLYTIFQVLSRIPVVYNLL